VFAQSGHEPVLRLGQYGLAEPTKDSDIEANAGTCRFKIVVTDDAIRPAVLDAVERFRKRRGRAVAVADNLDELPTDMN
jgi:hypothetical protein